MSNAFTSVGFTFTGFSNCYSAGSPLNNAAKTYLTDSTLVLGNWLGLQVPTSSKPIGFSFENPGVGNVIAARLLASSTATNGSWAQVGYYNVGQSWSFQANDYYKYFRFIFDQLTPGVGSSILANTQMIAQLAGAPNAAPTITYSFAPATALVRAQASAAGPGLINVAYGSLTLSANLTSSTIALLSGNTQLSTNAINFARNSWQDLGVNIRPGSVSAQLNGVQVIPPTAANVIGGSTVFSAASTTSTQIRNIALESINYVPQSMDVAKGVKANTFFGNLAWSYLTQRPTPTTGATVVQLVDSINSTATVGAATANAVNAVFVALDASKVNKTGNATVTGQVSVVAAGLANAVYVAGNIAATSNIYGVRWPDIARRPNFSTTDTIPEGTANLYYTNQRAWSAMGVPVSEQALQFAAGAFNMRTNANNQVGTARFSDSVADSATSNTAVANVAKAAYSAAVARVNKAGDTMTGCLTVQAAALANALVVQGKVYATSNVFGVQYSDVAGPMTGLVQLDDTTMSTSTQAAATANAVSALVGTMVLDSGGTMTGQLTVQAAQLANALVVRGNIAATSNVLGVQWTDIVARPAAFPPTVHQHVAANVVGFATNVQSSLSAASNLTYVGGVLGARVASQVTAGVVQLSDTIISASNALAATANAAKAASDAVFACVPKSGGVLTGRLDITAGNSALAVRNTGNTSRDQQAYCSVQTGGSAAGNAYLALDRAGAGGWSIGLDAGDAGKFAIRNSNVFGGGSVASMTVDGGGNVGLAACTAPTSTLDAGTGTVKFGPYVANADGLFVAATGRQLLTPTGFAYSSVVSVESNAYPLDVGT
jgi:hypothetical protein